MAEKTPAWNDQSMFRTMHSQTDSPFFSQLPAELTRMVFELALTEDEAYMVKSYIPGLSESDLLEDDSAHVSRSRNLIDPNIRWIRPGWTGQPTIAMSLLQTCKRIYLETHLLPIQLNEHRWCILCSTSVSTGGHRKVFYQRLTRDRATSGTQDAANGMSTAQMACIPRAHFFAQLYRMDDGVRPFASHLKAMAPSLRHLTITARLDDGSWNLRRDFHPITTHGLDREMLLSLGRDWQEAIAPLSKLRSLVISLENLDHESTSEPSPLHVLADCIAWLWREFQLDGGGILRCTTSSNSGGPSPSETWCYPGEMPLTFGGFGRSSRSICGAIRQWNYDFNNILLERPTMAAWSARWDRGDRGDDRCPPQA